MVMPPPLRKELQRKVHNGHQGISKCRERARQSIWRPSISKGLKELVQNYQECTKAQGQRSQPLTRSALHELPRQKVATELFEWKQEVFLLLVDYYSQYVDIARLNRLTATEVIIRTKSIFARHGIPETVISDNSPQFSSQAYKKFDDFQHLTSSPYFPQSNGEAERAVGTIKSLLKKSDDPYKALLAYRTTPLQIGYSPSELLMGCVLRSTVLMTRSQRAPRTPNVDTVQAHQANKAILKWDFDSHRGARQLLYRRLPDRETEGEVQEEVAPQSFQVETSVGSYHRNRPLEISKPSETTNSSEGNPLGKRNQPTEVRRSSCYTQPPEWFEPTWGNPRTVD